MIGLGLRLTVAGGREALVRLVLTAAAVGLGVTLLLTTLAGINGVGSQNLRYAWLETGPNQSTAALTGTPGASDDPLWWRIRADTFRGDLLARVDVAPTGPSSPVPPGIPALPRPGEMYVSPALASLLATTPAAELGDRFGARQVGIITDDALPSPDSLIAVIGHVPADLRESPDALQVSGISTVAPAGCGSSCLPGVGINAHGIALVLAVVAAALIVPVLVFIGSASRLSAARREQRSAAMRLVGATPRQVAAIAVVESGVAAVLGTLLGFLGFLLLRPLMLHIPFTGTRFFAGDLTLSPLDVAVVALGVPLASVVTARLGLRRVRISPLGVTRRVTPRQPRAARLLVLAAGLAEMTYFAVHGPPDGMRGSVLAFTTSVVLVIIGLVAAGPWLTMVGAGLVARRTSRASVLLAGRRLADDPRAGFRAISGLVLALFVGTVAVATVHTFGAERGAPAAGSVAASTLLREFSAADSMGTPALPGGLVEKLTSVPGVDGVAVVRADPSGAETDSWLGPGLITCGDLTSVPALGTCAAGSAPSQVVSIAYDGSSTAPSTEWPSSSASAGRLDALPVIVVAVAAPGRPDAIEKARTLIESALPGDRAPNTVGELVDEDNSLLDQYQQLVDIVIVISLTVAGCSLAVGIAGGLSDRRRPFSLLRLAGVPLRTLRRVILLESLVPLIAGSVVAVAMGLLTAQLFLHAQLHYRLRSPGPGYYLAIAGGLVVALTMIASVFPLLRRTTGPDAARND